MKLVQHKVIRVPEGASWRLMRFAAWLLRGEVSFIYEEAK